MPSIEENSLHWSQYHDWSNAGEEWSAWWGGSRNMWLGTLFPRLATLLPADSILEIAPGYGRCTQFLKQFCKELAIVDLNSNCIEHCRQRFQEDGHIRYFVNDGMSLDMIPDESIDFVFSYDSLVHAERDVMQAYLKQLGKKLKKNGAGFIHHSNLGMYTDAVTGELTTNYNPGWRGTTMSADLFREYSQQAGIHCMLQELIVWWEGTQILSDCFSYFTKHPENAGSPTVITQNQQFLNEAKRMITLNII
jgi:ubiquinone/menaquinone biosynthesis C-methylase UbiE